MANVRIVPWAPYRNLCVRMTRFPKFIGFLFFLKGEGKRKRDNVSQLYAD